MMISSGYSLGIIEKEILFMCLMCIKLVIHL